MYTDICYTVNIHISIKVYAVKYTSSGVFRKPTTHSKSNWTVIQYSPFIGKSFFVEINLLMSAFSG